jgi:hypothetical protein
MRKILLLSIFIAGAFFRSYASEIFIPMDADQKNHLKAYGITYSVLKSGVTADWLLNYRGGSFAFPWTAAFEAECNVRGVTYQVLADGQYNKIKEEIAYPETNQDVVKLEKPPKIAVYSPKRSDGTPLNPPWDDAVTLVLKYAEIPFDVIFDDEVLANKLPTYDWLHLHHEDFTGQYGKFWAQYHDFAWYKDQVKMDESTASRWGYQKVSQLKLAVAKKIRDFVLGGGYMFAMCSATDTYDIALAADGVDICETPFDGDGMDPQANEKLDFTKTFAFQNFTLEYSPYVYEFSSIDVNPTRTTEDKDYFTLFEYSAKWDPIPTMLTQDHERIIKGFMGQTTAFKKQYVKPTVTIMGENKSLNEARYIHGEYGKGMWTFYGGHDPEDYQHLVNNPPTDLNLHPNSPGYRLILNNVLFPAAKRQKQKT